MKKRADARFYLKGSAGSDRAAPGKAENHQQADQHQRDFGGLRHCRDQRLHLAGNEGMGSGGWMDTVVEQGVRQVAVAGGSGIAAVVAAVALDRKVRTTCG